MGMRYGLPCIQSFHKRANYIQLDFVTTVTTPKLIVDTGIELI